MTPIIAQSTNGEIRTSYREEDSMNNEPSLSGKQIVGLIVPPPDIRSIYLLLKFKFFKIIF